MTWVFSFVLGSFSFVLGSFFRVTKQWKPMYIFVFKFTTWNLFLISIPNGNEFLSFSSFCSWTSVIVIDSVFPKDHLALVMRQNRLGVNSSEFLEIIFLLHASEIHTYHHSSPGTNALSSSSAYQRKQITHKRNLENFPSPMITWCIQKPSCKSWATFQVSCNIRYPRTN